MCKEAHPRKENEPSSTNHPEPRISNLIFFASATKACKWLTYCIVLVL